MGVIISRDQREKIIQNFQYGFLSPVQLISLFEQRITSDAVHDIEDLIDLMTENKHTNSRKYNIESKNGVVQYTLCFSGTGSTVPSYDLVLNEYLLIIKVIENESISQVTSSTSKKNDNRGTSQVVSTTRKKSSFAFTKPSSSMRPIKGNFLGRRFR